MREAVAQQQVGDVVADIVAGAAQEGPAGQRLGRRRRQAARHGADAGRVARQRRMRVHPAQFQGDVARAQIGFLEDPGPQAAPLGQGDGGDMARPAVAEHHKVGHAMGVDQRLQRIGPLRVGAGEVGGVGPLPEQPVAGVEVDAMDGMPARGQRIAQPDEQMRRQPLQEQEGPPPGHPQHLPLIPGPASVAPSISPASGAAAPAGRRARGRARPGGRAGPPESWAARSLDPDSGDRGSTHLQRAHRG